jgi:hypothetical protein
VRHGYIISFSRVRCGGSGGGLVANQKSVTDQNSNETGPLAPRGFEMKNERGFGTALLLESFAAVVFAGVFASHVLAGQGTLGKAYDMQKFSGSNVVMMMDSRPRLFNRYHIECEQGKVLPDKACRTIRTAYEVNGPTY